MVNNRNVLCGMVCLVSWVFLCTTTSFAGIPRLLAGDSDHPTQIVHAAKAGPTTKFAASELQKYLKQMTGVRCPTVDDKTAQEGFKILLSSMTNPNALAEKLLASDNRPVKDSDAFVIRTFADAIVIAGGRQRSVLFGVYDFLERLGCRWFGPLEEYVPSAETLEVPSLNIHEKPKFRWRAFELIGGSDPAVVDWMAKIKLNGCWPEKYSPNKDMTESQAYMGHTAVHDMIKRDLHIFWGGHVLPQLFSPETYKDHPEYFAEIDGKRLDFTHYDRQGMSQPCVSNPEAMRVLSDSTVKFLRNHPWLDTLILWGGDSNQWCECAECRKLESDPDKESSFGGLDRSATYCYMIKKINEAVQKELPGRQIGFNHYYNLEDLPVDKNGKVRTSVMPARNVLSCVDAYRQCDRHAFTNADCPKGKRIEPIARMWAPYCDDSISWSYYWSWNFMKGLPISMVHKIPEDFKFVRSLGVNGVLDNVSLLPSTLDQYDFRPNLFLTDHFRYNIINMYVFAKAAWNPDLDVDSVVGDFIKHYYGSAAEPMEKFWALMEDGWTKFGSDPAFMPEDKKLATSKAMHTWVKNIRYVIPNRRVFDGLEQHLKEARHLAASAYNQPLKAQYMPYLERVQLLERAIANWPTTETDTKWGHK